MKVSTLLFQAAALVGAISFSKAQEDFPWGDKPDFVVPAGDSSHVLVPINSGFAASGFVAPATEFSLAVDIALKAILDPEDYTCEVSKLGSYITNLLEGSDDIANYYRLLNYYRVGDWLYFATLWYNNGGTDNVFGSVEQSAEFRNRFNNMQSWEPDLDGALLKNFNGQLFKNTAVMIYVLKYAFFADLPFTNEVYYLLQDHVTTVQGLIESDAGIGYDSPIWSLNAFAISYGDAPPDSPPYPPDQIHFGTGLLDFFEDVNVDDGGPDYVLSHEFAHLLQMNLNVTFENTPESTRKTELMADALSAYYLTHEDGAAFQGELIEQLTEAAFNIGDCQFYNPGHHGTPNQRKAAVVYGVEVANFNAVVSNSTILLRPVEFIAAFNADYDTLIAPDCPSCRLRDRALRALSGFHQWARK
jgi:hypothetical protein